jgi:hypothetical protein
MTSITYVFVFNVTAPGGTIRTASKSMLSTQSSWSVSANYPADFPGSSLSLVGNYSVVVAETLPSPIVSVATTQFLVSLTDSLLYQRTFPVSIKAGGYLAADNVTFSLILNGSPVAGFPTSRQADANGIVSLVWQTLRWSSVGNYSITLSGKNTSPKTPPDIQQFKVSPANVTIPWLWKSTNSLQRSETLNVRFNASYGSGVSVTSGSSIVRLVEPDGFTSHSTNATYDSTLRTFQTFYTVPLNRQTGTWAAVIDKNGFGDGYGNGGPLQGATQTFSVQPALLTISIIQSSKAYAVGDVLQIYAGITAPDGTTFTQGAVSASLTLSGRPVAGPVHLSYDPTRAEWFGGYQLGSTDPGGTWLVTVSASDGYGNGGSSSVSYTVNVPPYQNLTSNWLLWLGVLTAAAFGFVIFITRHRGVSRREVKLDISAIRSQADRVKKDDFLQSVQAQLKRHAEREAREKSSAESAQK